MYVGAWILSSLLCWVGFSEGMTSVACAVSPVGKQTAATPSLPLRYPAVSCSSSSSSPASTSASFPVLPSFKAAASAFVAQQPLGSSFHGRRDSLGSTLNSSVTFDNGLFESGRLRVPKVSAVVFFQVHCCFGFCEFAQQGYVLGLCYEF